MFQANEQIDNITTWIRRWFEDNAPGLNAVIGISGGKDSTVAAALCAKALGKDKVIGVLMPNGQQADIADSRHVIEILGIHSYEIQLEKAISALREAVEGTMDKPFVDQARINLPPRIRMATLYAVAQNVEGGGIVINTCNKSEDFIGYSTKYGDAAGDISILSDFTVAEVLQLGDALGLPETLVHKAPSDGLCGKTDEDNLGFTYAMLDRYIAGERDLPEDVMANIERRHNAGLHKLRLMPAYRR